MNSAAPDWHLASPSGTRCLEGTIHACEARGHYEKIADVETYITKPSVEKADGHVLANYNYLPDVRGMFPNGHSVMDSVGDAGYLTLGLDYFQGVGKIKSDKL